MACVKPLNAKNASKSSGKNGDLTMHVQTVHGDGKAFKCKAFFITFMQKGSLRTHLHTVHGRLKCFERKDCLKNFGQHSDLKKHLRMVH